MNKQMTEAENTLEEIRKDYREQVRAWFNLNYEKHDQNYDYSAMLDQCTTLQLRELCRLINQKTDFKLLRSVPTDHLAVTFADIYVGIEIDGYMHS